jgi:hypothetical protein
MTDYSTLVSAIRDTGVWRWWTERLPDIFQIEFSGVQLYMPPEDKNKPPSSILALRFYRPSFVGFIRRKDGSKAIPQDWPSLMREDKLDLFSVSYDEFALGDEKGLKEVVSQIESEEVHFASEGGGKNICFAFWAYTIGIRIDAQDVRPVFNAGEVDLSSIEQLHSAWWTYWQDYWKKRETPEAYPKDYACEVTIPTERFHYSKPKEEPS